MSHKGKGWVNKLVLRSIPPEHKFIAGALLDHGKNWSKSATLILAFAPVWLLVSWILSDCSLSNDTEALIQTVEWGVPAVILLLGTFPMGNSMRRAVELYPVGSGPVPFFSTLPVSIRSLLKISERVTLVRCIIFGAIATPFFSALAAINKLPEAATGIFLAIPMLSIVWYFSRPVLIWNRVQSSLKRRKGIFFLHYATTSVEIALVVLWLLAGLAGVALAFIFGVEASTGFQNQSYPVLLGVGSIVAAALSAAFARVMLEIMINEIRHRRYDWTAPAKGLGK